MTTFQPLPHPKSSASHSSAAANAAAASFAALNAQLCYLDDADRERVRLAYRFADEAHLGQMRKNGEPYITHPIAVAAICAKWRLDVNALMAALLHDAIEDCGVTKLELAEKFGSTVAELVDGLTKLEKIKFTSREENQAESFRKMLLAMSRDIRVMLIKLADRSHNMRTLGDVPRSKWARTATETLEIHAPIAHRLGLNQTYQELQDLCLRFLRPWRYQTLAKAIAKAKLRRVDMLDKVRYEVESSLQEAGLNAKVVGREKSIFSIYKKMEKKKLSFAHVNDIYGFRIVVPKITDCYTALGVLHQLYKPVPGRLKDYIAIPKNNGYQSLHTTLVGPASINIEFQTRTEEMDIVAEVQR
jgi:GTP pyrophosphokinase